MWGSGLFSPGAIDHKLGIAGAPVDSRAFVPEMSTDLFLDRVWGGSDHGDLSQ